MMQSNKLITLDAVISRRLKMLGMLLFLFGLLTGFVMSIFKNPRMGLAAHLEGIMNGVFLVIAGIIWHELKISPLLKRITFITLLYGTYANWLTTIFSAFYGTSNMTPIAGKGFVGENIEEKLVSVGFASVALAMVFSLAIIIYGLRGRKNQVSDIMP
jgi:(hydroxyamino)benzene mutase